MTAKRKDEPAVTMADTSALNGTVTPVDEAKPFISAGMASDLEQHGWTVDPLTGRKITK